MCPSHTQHTFPENIVNTSFVIAKQSVWVFLFINGNDAGCFVLSKKIHFIYTIFPWLLIHANMQGKITPFHDSPPPPLSRTLTKRFHDILAFDIQLHSFSFLNVYSLKFKSRIKKMSWCLLNIFYNHPSPVKLERLP